MSPMEYAYAAGSGALVIMGIDFYIQGNYWEMGLAILTFLFSIWMIKLQPTNVSGGMIVQLDPFKVHQFVDGRDIQWCGDKHLHDMHAWWFKPDAMTISVCLGHECHVPEVHMERVTTK